MKKETELKDVSFELRKKLGISQRELAHMIGSTQTEISFIEKGFIPTAEEKVFKIYQIASNAGVVNKAQCKN